MDRAEDPIGGMTGVRVVGRENGAGLGDDLAEQQGCSEPAHRQTRRHSTDKASFS